MPVILDPDDYGLWLNGKLHRAEALASRPYSESGMYREALWEVLEGWKALAIADEQRRNVGRELRAMSALTQRFLRRLDD